jgi:hypothetical protein
MACRLWLLFSQKGLKKLYLHSKAVRTFYFCLLCIAFFLDMKASSKTTEICIKLTVIILQDKVGLQHGLNRELDFQSLFGIHVHSCSHWLRLLIPPPPHLGSYTRALLVSQGRRHLFVNPWSAESHTNSDIFIFFQPLLNGC